MRCTNANYGNRNNQKHNTKSKSNRNDTKNRWEWHKNTRLVYALSLSFAPHIWLNVVNTKKNYSWTHWSEHTTSNVCFCYRSLCSCAFCLFIISLVMCVADIAMYWYPKHCSSHLAWSWLATTLCQKVRLARFRCNNELPMNFTVFFLGLICLMNNWSWFDRKLFRFIRTSLKMFHHYSFRTAKHSICAIFAAHDWHFSSFLQLGSFVQPKTVLLWIAQAETFNGPFSVCTHSFWLSSIDIGLSHFTRMLVRISGSISMSILAVSFHLDIARIFVLSVSFPPFAACSGSQIAHHMRAYTFAYAIWLEKVV